MGPGGGDNKMNEGTSFQPSEPIPCSNGCGFFGTPATNNLCSKCFRDCRMEEESAAKAKVAFEKFSMSAPSSSEGIKKPFLFGPGLPPTPGTPSIFSNLATKLSENPADVGKLTFGTDLTKLPPGGINSPLPAQSQSSQPAQDAGVPMFGADAEGKKPVVRNRCGCCNKKVGVMGFACRCGVTFCGTHRYPESHDCSFDFKAQGREAIAKANPVVKGDKIQRF